MTVRTDSIDSFKTDKRNANRGTKRGKSSLRTSVEELGAGRSVLADVKGNLIAGNQTLQAAKDLGIKDVIVVETDGKSLVVVQRTDLDLENDDDARRARRLAYADNRVGELNLDFDFDMILADARDGVDLSFLWTDLELGIEVPDFEPPEIQGDTWMIVLTCETEDEQVELLQEFAERGVQCRALVS